MLSKTILLKKGPLAYMPDQAKITYFTDEQNLEVFTIGGSLIGLYDLRIQVTSSESLADAEFLLSYTMDYQLEHGEKIHPNDTLIYGFWLIKFCLIPQGSLHELIIYELNPELNIFIPGADHAMKYWREQVALCKEAGVEFTPTGGNQIAIISETVWAGGVPMLGVRENQQNDEHSGWLFFQEDDEIDREHFYAIYLYQLACQRPELIKFLAIPHGYWFSLSEEGYKIFIDSSDSDEPYMLN